MQSTKSIKQRIKSVKSTSQITKAMEAVSATKMRKSQEFALQARPYALASLELFKNLITRIPKALLPSVFQSRIVKKSLLLVITSDKGLSGAFNANVIRKTEGWVNVYKNNQKQFELVTVGKKAKEYFSARGPLRQSSSEASGSAPGGERSKIVIVKSFEGFGDFSEIEDTIVIADLILDGFKNNLWDEVFAAYTNFRSTLRQETVLKKILPATQEGIEEIIFSILPERGKYSELRREAEEKSAPDYKYEYILEPSPQEILLQLIPQLLRIHVHHIILESNASEHSARMIAMKNASENANELIDELSLQYNKSRQAGITRELTEITAGREALGD